MKGPPFILALQVCPIDFEVALQVAIIMVRLQPERRTDVEVALFVRDDMPEELIAELREALDDRFPTFVVRSTRNGRGWPMGCNDLWQSCMSEIGRLARNRRPDLAGAGVLTFEPDCVPVSRWWIDELRKEWNTAKAGGMLACGSSVIVREGDEDSRHINGNAIFDIAIIKQNLDLQSCSGAWDFHHRRYLLSVTRPTDKIAQLYQKTDLTREQVLDIIRSGAVLIHGVKDHSVRTAIRLMLARNELD